MEFFRLGLVCKPFQTILKNDSIWSVAPGAVRFREDDRLKSNRERVMVQYALDAAQSEQKKTGNILLEELGVDRVKTLVHAALRLHTPNSPTDRHIIECREDTLHVIVEMVQDIMCRFLHLANLSLAMKSLDSSTYPELTRSDLQLQEAVSHDGTVGTILFNWNNIIPETLEFRSERLVKEQVARRMLRRAGALKVEGEIFMSIWFGINYCINLLTLDGCIELLGASPVTSCEKDQRHLAPGETIRSVPPLSWINESESLPGGKTTMHTLVPSQVENCSQVILGMKGGHRKVYGEDWLVSGNKSKEAIIAQHQSRYVGVACALDAGTDADGDFVMDCEDTDDDDEDMDLDPRDLDPHRDCDPGDGSEQYLRNMCCVS